MGILDRFFSKKENPVHDYAGFWKWFAQHDSEFFLAVFKGTDIEALFFDLLGPKLDELRPGLYFLAGMMDRQTAELIITVEGKIENIVFAEELVAAAPALKNWKFTALKKAGDTSTTEMSGFTFDAKRLSFFATTDSRYPDEIDITFVHSEFTEESRNDITNGTYIFLDSFLGEFNLINQIDNISVTGGGPDQPEHISLEKLKDYLAWREKEFVEKYDGTWYNTAKDEYSVLTTKSKTGQTNVVLVNNALLGWEMKASHPWIMEVKIMYPDKDRNGMPEQATAGKMQEIEDALAQKLKDADGYLNVGRQTGENVRTIFMACKEFRRPSKVMNSVMKSTYGDLEIEFEIFKDKYWQCFNHFGSVS